jgi:excisionase family DNA binding protein
MGKAEMGQPALLVSLKEAARILSLSERTVWSMVKTGTLPHVRVNRRLLFSPSGLQGWIDARQTGSSQHGNEAIT